MFPSRDRLFCSPSISWGYCTRAAVAKPPALQHLGLLPGRPGWWLSWLASSISMTASVQRVPEFRRPWRQGWKGSVAHQPLIPAHKAQGTSVSPHPLQSQDWWGGPLLCKATAPSVASGRARERMRGISGCMNENKPHGPEPSLHTPGETQI